MAAGMTTAKRFVIRTSLITGSTVALIVGAQTLITVDVQAGRGTNSSNVSASNMASSTTSTTTSGVRIIRQADAPITLFSGDDDSFESQQNFFNQQLQPQFDQQNQLFSSQQTFQPRTHSSR